MLNIYVFYLNLIHLMQQHQL